MSSLLLLVSVVFALLVLVLEVSPVAGVDLSPEVLVSVPNHSLAVSLDASVAAGGLVDGALVLLSVDLSPIPESAVRSPSGDTCAVVLTGS